MASVPEKPRCHEPGVWHDVDGHEALLRRSALSLVVRHSTGGLSSGVTHAVNCGTVGSSGSETTNGQRIPSGSESPDRPTPLTLGDPDRRRQQIRFPLSNRRCDGSSRLPLLHPHRSLHRPGEFTVHGTAGFGVSANRIPPPMAEETAVDESPTRLSEICGYRYRKPFRRGGEVSGPAALIVLSGDSTILFLRF